MDTILFVCTGNTCRSPMAEAIAQRWLAEHVVEGEQRYLAASAGIAAVVGAPPSAEAVAALEKLSIAHDGRSKPLSADMIRHARAVFCMTRRHVDSALALVGGDETQTAKIHLLDPTGDVEDPIGLGQSVYDSLAQRFMKVIPQRLSEVFPHEDRAGLRSSRR
jgi:protein-tyrosine-phosphatase